MDKKHTPGDLYVKNETSFGGFMTLMLVRYDERAEKASYFLTSDSQQAKVEDCDIQTWKLFVPGSVWVDINMF